MTDRLRHLWLTAAAILVLASCTQDDMGEGGSPYDGDSPVVFSATGITPLGATRATVDDDPTWEGTEKVTVRVGFDVKKTYVVKTSADKKSATLEAAPGVEPFKWSEVEGKAVEAYTTENVLDDQSELENYRASDWLHASVNNMTRTSVLDFKHQVARLVIKVSNGDFAKDKVKLVVGDRTITPYRYEDGKNSRYLAIVKSGSISLSVKIHHGDKDYIYTHAMSGRLVGGDSYTVNVKIDKTMHITDEATLKAWAAAVEQDPTVSAIVDNDFSMTAPADGASNWEPIAKFDGIFDGNGKTISGIVVKNKSSIVGFIWDNKGTVKNLTLKDTKINSSSPVGAVAGYNNTSGIIENCHVTGASELWSSGNCAGGVVGWNYGRITACHVAKECKVKGCAVGGIVGSNNFSGPITGCYALCSLEGDKIGGICWELNSGSLTACYSKCSYNSSGSNIGGIVGEIWTDNPKFSACYWQGDTNCEKGVGSETTDPNGVTQVGAAGVIWEGIDGYMNTALEGTGYRYEISDDEPLVLVKTQQ